MRKTFLILLTTGIFAAMLVGVAIGLIPGSAVSIAARICFCMGAVAMGINIGYTTSELLNSKGGDEL